MYQWNSGRMLSWWYSSGCSLVVGGLGWIVDLDWVQSLLGVPLDYLIQGSGGWGHVTHVSMVYPPGVVPKDLALVWFHVIKKRMLSWCCSQLVSTFDWFAVGILMLKKNLVEFDTLSAVIIALQWIVFFVLVIVWLEFSILKQVTVLGNKGKETSFKVGLLIDIFYSKSK